jgi:hypothetical protein
LKFSTDKVFVYWKKRQQIGIEDATILEWIKFTQPDNNLLIKFVNYQPTVQSSDLIKQGYKGKELGDKIRELEIQKFNESMKNRLQTVLPMKWIQHLTKLPETGIGYQLVDIYMNDGNILRSIEVLNSSIAQVQEGFDAEKIISIKLVKGV